MQGTSVYYEGLIIAILFIMLIWLSMGLFSFGLAAILSAWSGKTRPFRSAFYVTLIFIFGTMFWFVVLNYGITVCASFNGSCPPSAQDMIRLLGYVLIFLGPIVFFGWHLRHRTKNNSPTHIVKGRGKTFLFILGLVMVAFSFFVVMVSLDLVREPDCEGEVGVYCPE